MFLTKTLSTFTFMENNRIRPLAGLPLADRVIIEPDPAESVTKSGIIIPDTAKEQARTGVVRSVGPGRDTTAMTCRVGDHVLYGKFAGSEMIVFGEDLVVMRESDVLYILDFAPDAEQATRQQEALTSQGFSSMEDTLPVAPGAAKVTLDATVAGNTPILLKATAGGYATLAECLTPLISTPPKELGPKEVQERLTAAAMVLDPVEFSRLETMVFNSGMENKISEYLSGFVTAMVRKYDGVPVEQDTRSGTFVGDNHKTG